MLSLWFLLGRAATDPRDDLDLASLGIVKILEGHHGTTYPDMAWEPKAAFTAVAEHYGGGDDTQIRCDTRLLGEEQHSLADRGFRPL